MKLLIIGFVFPEPASSAAGGRMMQLISLFQSRGWEVVFASPAADSEFAADLESIGVKRQHILLNDASFDDFVKKLDPDAVLFDRFMIEEQFGWRVAEHCPRALRILDTEDLHCLRLARQQAWKEKRASEPRDLFSDTAKREVASIYRSDLTLMISEFEMALLQETFKVDASQLYYLPLFATLQPDWKSFAERKHFIFIGNFLHEPNWNAVQYLKESIWPLIRSAMPKAELHVYGAYPSQKVFNLHKPAQGFFIDGRAGDAMEITVHARVSLAPLRFGAGIKGKLLEAMACGTPSVTTSIGAESMQGNLEWNGAVADDPETFAAASVELYNDPERWQQAQENGKAILETRYDRTLFEADLLDRIDDLIANPEVHRQQHFTGAMLMHHTMMGVKYMARWIEGKSRH